MFRVERNVPDVYIEESRDFQLVARLYDLVFQSARYSIDSMRYISDTTRCNAELLPLIATKVGLLDQQEVLDKSYRAVLSAFPHIIRHKGSLTAVSLIANLFERVTNTSVEVIKSRDNIAIIFDSYTPTDVSLFLTLLQYVRPAGFMIDYYARTALDVPSGAFALTQNEATMTDWYAESAANIVTSSDSETLEDGVKVPHVGFASVTLNGITESSQGEQLE